MTDTLNNKIRWGILGTAKIARQKLIPAINSSSSSEVIAVASRSQEQAQTFADDCNIAKAYGSYQELLEAPDIDAVYIPLPNHLHVLWAIKALEAGKHVLCEKPLGLDYADAEKLARVSQQYPNLVMMEAFMYRFHPQWIKAKKLIQSGSIGKVSSIEASFSYFNREPNNVRNQAEIGGGGLMDVGCYCISACRYLYDSEPQRVVGLLDYDEEFGIDKHAHGMLNFAAGQATIFCSTQSEPSQRVYIIGTSGALLLDSPFYQTGDGSAQLRVYHDLGETFFNFPDCDQYSIQVDSFAKAVRHNLSAPTPISDALANMKVIDAMFASHKNKSWIDINQ